MSAVAEVLSRHGIDPGDQVFAAALDRVLAALPGAGAQPLPAAELQFLIEHGGPEAAGLEQFDPAQASMAQAAAGLAAARDFYANSLTVSQAAELLGIDRTRVSHRIRSGALWSVKIASDRRIPAWQIDHTRPLPHLRDIITAIPAEADPLDIAALMTTPQDELGGRSAIQHLVGGGDPKPVTELIAQLSRW